MNRLGSATSPYLLQHADNPVDWHEWSPEAFDEARERDVPVLLSVGYAACHWCHVMAHESFEDDSTAALMNERYVNIKVDREERPDVDAVYMEAVQGMTGQGGWPMTVFLTPSEEPFYAGTYFPPRPSHGMPSFTQVLLAVSDAWTERRGDVERAGKEIVEQLAGRRELTGAGGPPDEAKLHDAVRVLARDFDATRGGFGGAPKFPPSMTLEHLLRHDGRTGSSAALDMVGATCEAMARGGMYDQLGGGFARYSVDADWVVPHFEKMLYDNALLARVYAHWWRATGSTTGRRIAIETADWIIRDLRTTEGGFASSLDADSEGEEGRYYVWTAAQLIEVLGDEDGAWAAELLWVTERGTFEHGSSVLQLRSDPGDAARWDDVRQRLTQAREKRVRPGRDDKVVAAFTRRFPFIDFTGKYRPYAFPEIEAERQTGAYVFDLVGPTTGPTVVKFAIFNSNSNSRQLAREALGEPHDEPGAKPRERNRRGDRGGRERQVATARDLAALARFLQLFLCRFFCALLRHGPT